MAMLQQEASCYSVGIAPGATKRLSNKPQHQQDFNNAVRVLQDIFQLLSLQHHETLVIAASYLSRYYSSMEQQQHQRQGAVRTSTSLPLTALVCFYMAVKVHESAAIPLRSVCDLYQRFFAVHHSSDDDCVVTLARLEQLELDICRVLEWRLHPPIPLGFVRRLLVVDNNNNNNDAAAAAKIVLEQAFFADAWAYGRQHQASTLAKAALAVTAGGSNRRHDRELRRAVAFLRDCSSSSTVCPFTNQPMPLSSPLSSATTLSSSSTTTTTTTTSLPPPTPTTTSTTRTSKQEQQRFSNKRCVSPLLSLGCVGTVNDHENRRCHKRRRKEHDSLVVGYCTWSGIAPTTITPVSLWGKRPMSAFSTPKTTASTLKRTLRSPRSALSMAFEGA